MSDEDIRYLEQEFAEVTAPTSAKQFRTWIYRTLAGLSISTTSWKPGAVVRLIVSVVSVLAAILSEQIAEIARGGFIVLARGRWKGLCALGTYGLRRRGATFAQGLAVVTNTSAQAYDIAANAMTISGPNGKSYRNTSPFTIPAASSVSTTFSAVEIGSASSVAIGVVNRVLSPTMLGVTVLNSTAFSSSDEESDPGLERRCLTSVRALSPFAPREAFEQAALNATRTNGTLVGVTRVSISRYSTGGMVTVRVATDGGAVPGVYTDPATDLGAVHAAILRATPPGVTPVTASATVRAVPVTVIASWLRGRPLPLTDAQFDALVRTALTEKLRTIRIGGLLVSSGALGDVFGIPDSVVRETVARELAGVEDPYQISVYAPYNYTALAYTEVPVLGVLSAHVAACNDDGTL